MKCGEHDWFSANHLSAIKWMDNKSVILLSNYLNPKETQKIDCRVKGSKGKDKVTCPTVIYEYNQFMGGVDLINHMKVHMKLIAEVIFASTSESSLIFLISLLSIQTLFIIKLHQHLQ